MSGETMLKQILGAVVETVREAGPTGAPGGHIYAALMHVGVTLDQYERIMDTLVQAKILVKRGQCYFPGEREVQ